MQGGRMRGKGQEAKRARRKMKTRGKQVRRNDETDGAGNEDEAACRAW